MQAGAQPLGRAEGAALDLSNKHFRTQRAENEAGRGAQRCEAPGLSHHQQLAGIVLAAKTLSLGTQWSKQKIRKRRSFHFHAKLHTVSGCKSLGRFRWRYGSRLLSGKQSWIFSRKCVQRRDKASRHSSALAWDSLDESPHSDGEVDDDSRGGKAFEVLHNSV